LRRRAPVGPGNLFPIAIVIGGIVIGASSVAGAAAGWAIRATLRTVSRFLV
jgi:hypothetical protein